MVTLGEQIEERVSQTDINFPWSIISNEKFGPKNQNRWQIQFDGGFSDLTRKLYINLIIPKEDLEKNKSGKLLYQEFCQLLSQIEFNNVDRNFYGVFEDGLNKSWLAIDSFLIPDHNARVYTSGFLSNNSSLNKDNFFDNPFLKMFKEIMRLDEHSIEYESLRYRKKSREDSLFYKIQQKNPVNDPKEFIKLLFQYKDLSSQYLELDDDKNKHIFYPSFINWNNPDSSSIMEIVYHRYSSTPNERINAIDAFSEFYTNLTKKKITPDTGEISDDFSYFGLEPVKDE